MMNILGIDVSKNKLDCVLLCASKPEKELYKKVANSPAGFQTLIHWCMKKAKCDPHELHAVMEATGPYHEACALALFEADLKVSIVNPAKIKSFSESLGKKAKNDKQDASTIAEFGSRMKKLRFWQPDPQEYQDLRALLYRLEALRTDIQRETNRLEKAETSELCPQVIESLERSIGFLKNEKADLEKQIKTHINSHPQLKMDQKLLESIPGIGTVLSSWMLLLLQDGQRFETAPQAAAYVGLTPTEHTSGNSVSKRPHLSKAGPAVFRAKLYMPAIVAAKHNPDVRDLYQRLLARGKTKMAALGAAMRKLVHICFGVIKHQTPYQAQIAN